MLHSSDPSTPYLSCAARVEDFATTDLDAALYEERALWRLHAMRRTLFVASRDDALGLLAGATRDIARVERRKFEGMVATATDVADAGDWISAVEAQVLAALRERGTISTTELSAAVPELATEVSAGSGRWAQTMPVSRRLLLLMAMDGAIVRGLPAGTWRSSQYAWTSHEAWFGEPLGVPDTDAARAQTIERYLDRYGPATLEDMTWWTGWGVRACAAALARVGAVEVALESGVGYALPGSLAETTTLERVTAALLPSLDSTAMGWRVRDWYLCEGWEVLFDRNGNVGPTIWVDGRIVGGWASPRDGGVRTRLLVDVGAEARRLVDAEAERLADWLGGTGVTPRFRTPLERELAG